MSVIHFEATPAHSTDGIDTSSTIAPKDFNWSIAVCIASRVWGSKFPNATFSFNTPIFNPETPPDNPKR